MRQFPSFVAFAILIILILLAAKFSGYETSHHNKKHLHIGKILSDTAKR